MHKLDPSRFGVLGLGLLSLLIVSGLVLGIYNRSRIFQVTIAAGGSAGESYVIAQAIKEVAARHYPRLKITVRETGGTTENLKLLESAAVQFAAAQSDVAPGPAARAVAHLYPDIFQLLVHRDAPVRRFSELKGKRIALSKSGGQFRSFVHVAEHFGLREADFQFVGKDDAGADEEFVARRADAVFRVRALGSPSISRLVREGDVAFVSIRHAAAMRIKIPAFEPATIPEGAYLGDPPVPPEDLQSVSVERTLLAHKAADAEPVHWITSLLMEHRQELAEAIPDRNAEVRPLLAVVKRPNTESGLGVMLHEGAQDYYDKDKPSFVHEQADVLALIVTLLVLVGSWLWELKRWIGRKQKNQADQYTNRAVLIMNRAMVSESGEELDRLRGALLEMLTDAVKDLDFDKLSLESFQSFRAVWQISLEVISERRKEVLSVAR